MSKDRDSHTDQPLPKGTGKEITPLVISDIQKRTDNGFRKYGERLRAFNGRNAMQDAYEEVLDLSQYLRQVLEEWPDVGSNHGWLGWVAGIIDGEGSLTVGISQTGKYYQAALQVVNTDIKMLLKLQEVTGIGSIYLRKKRPGQLPCCVWNVSLQPAIILLKQILPWLITKKEQAELFIQLAKVRETRPQTSKGNSQITSEEWDLVEKITVLKLGGKKHKNKRHTNTEKLWSDKGTVVAGKLLHQLDRVELSADKIKQLIFEQENNHDN